MIPLQELSNTIKLLGYRFTAPQMFVDENMLNCLIVDIHDCWHILIIVNVSDGSDVHKLIESLKKFYSVIPDGASNYAIRPKDTI